MANRLPTDCTLTEAERAVFYSSALYSAIRLFTSTGVTGKSLDEICLRFDLPRAKAAAMVRYLTDTGLCVEKDGRYSLGAQKTHLEDSSPYLQKHHGNWRLRAMARSEDLAPGELMYTVPVSLSRGDFARLREDMIGFIQQFLDRVHASPAEEVACFNLDFFWVKK